MSKILKANLTQEEETLDFASKKALKVFDKWNNVTGFFQKETSAYYEMQEIIKYAVMIGIQQIKG